MAEIWYGHFDSTAEDKRELLAEDWAKYVRAFLGDGVRNGGECLRITADNDGMKVKMDSGYANVQGYIFLNREDHLGRFHEIEIPEANPNLSRIDRVILRLDRTIPVRTIEAVVLVGTAGSGVPKDLTRNENIWELSLAQIRVSANAVSIAAGAVTDERLNPTVCGIIDSLITAETEGMFYDFTAKFDEMLGAANSAFEEQMTAQQSDYEEFKEEVGIWQGEIDGWKDMTITELAAVVSFDFDNPFAFPGTVTTYAESAVGGVSIITEEMRFVSDDGLLAKQTTSFLLNGDITEEQIVYEPSDTSTVFRHVMVTTTFVNGNPKTTVEAIQ